MKFQLTITDASPSDLARLFAVLSGSTADVQVSHTAPTADPSTPMPGQPVLPTMQPPQPVAEHDADSGPVNPSAPSVDAAGLPWDERIHSTNKGQNADGTWRKRRGVDAAVVTQVEAELRARGQQQPAPAPMQQPFPVPPMPMPPVPVQPMQPVGMPIQQPPMVQPHQPAPMPMPEQFQQPAPVQPQQPPAQPGSIDFNTFMQHLSAKMQAGQIDQQIIINATQAIGQAFNKQLTVITDVANDQNMINYAVQYFSSIGRW